MSWTKEDYKLAGVARVKLSMNANMIRSEINELRMHPEHRLALVASIQSLMRVRRQIQEEVAPIRKYQKEQLSLVNQHLMLAAHLWNEQTAIGNPALPESIALTLLNDGKKVITTRAPSWTRIDKDDEATWPPEDEVVWLAVKDCDVATLGGITLVNGGDLLNDIPGTYGWFVCYDRPYLFKGMMICDDSELDDIEPTHWRKYEIPPLPEEER